MARGKRNTKPNIRATEMTYDGIQKKGRFSTAGASNWRSPNQFYTVDADAFIDPKHKKEGSLPLDRAIALRLLKFSFNRSASKPDFWAHHRWYSPLNKHIFFEIGTKHKKLEKLAQERESLLEAYHQLKGDAIPSSEIAGTASAEAWEEQHSLRVQHFQHSELTMEEILEQGKRARDQIDKLSHQLDHFYEHAPLIHPEDTCPGMMVAAQRLNKAVDDEELIAVWCDYDVDGLTAGEVLRRALEPYKAKFFYGWADAKAGFGVSEGFINEAAKRGAKLFVTLDCGSGAAEQIKLAQDLGMEVIVVDHHTAGDEAQGNPANHHLNPKLFETPTSLHTGSQLAWKLGAAAQIDREGKARDDFWEEPLYLAGMGCIADMGSTILHENRAFFWLANDKAPLGVRLLAKELGEETDVPGQMILTQACLNLAKRTPLVTTSDVGALLAAKTEKEARPYIKKLAGSYKLAQTARKEMIKVALEQTGQAEKDFATGKIDRPDPDVRLAIAVIDDDEYADYLGYSGPVAAAVSRATGKPAFVFVRNGDDVKFSGRNDSGVPVKLGDLIENPDLRAACTVGDGEDVGEPEEINLGGHAEVVSGRLHPDKIPEALKALEDWAAKERVWFSQEEKVPPTPFVQEKLVAPERLPKIEEEARHISPFSNFAQPIFFRPGQEETTGWNDEVKITVAGELRGMVAQDDNERYLKGQLVLANGDTREACYPADEEIPEGPMQWLLRIGKSGPYYLRRFAELPPEQESQWHKSEVPPK